LKRQVKSSQVESVHRAVRGRGLQAVLQKRELVG